MAPAARPLEDKVVVATTGRPGAGLVSALAHAGAAVGLLDHDDAPTGADQLVGDSPAALAVRTELGSRGETEAAMATVRAALGPIDAVVHAAIPQSALEPVPFAELSSQQWKLACEQLLRTTLFVLQAAHTHLRHRGGHIVLVTPTLALTGAAGLAAYSAAAEGQRGLGKSAARQWGKLGITVNFLAPSVGGDEVLTTADRALASADDAGADLGPVVSFLASDSARFVTGQTLVVDGGVWMTG